MNKFENFTLHIVNAETKADIPGEDPSPTLHFEIDIFVKVTNLRDTRGGEMMRIFCEKAVNI